MRHNHLITPSPEKRADYMVHKALYKDILLEVAARNQNQQVLKTATEKLESRILQIEDSHDLCGKT